MVYKFREGRSAPVPAQVIGEQLKEIASNNDGIVTPKAVVDVARPKEAPLHPCFEWNNKAAAELYREDQARRLITVISVDRQMNEYQEERPTVAYVSVGQPKRDGAGYVSLTTALSDETMRSKVLSDAISGLRAWQVRFGHLEELASVVEVIDSIKHEMAV